MQRTDAVRARRTGVRPGCGFGFTLIELLVALALAAIIGGVAVVAFAQTSGVGLLAHARIEAQHNARTALRMIENDLRSAYIDPDGFLFRGEAAALDFFSTSGQGGAARGPARVGYRHAAAPGSGNLLRVAMAAGEEALASPPALEPADDEDHAVAFNVVEFRLRYHHGDVGGWVDAWDSSDSGSVAYRRMPQAVEVMISAVDDNGRLQRDGREPEHMRLLIEPDIGRTR